jgi:hypothetical protein
VGIPFDLGKRVMFSVDRDPFFGRDTSRQPDGEPERKGRNGVKLEGFMRCAAMQKDRGAENRHLGDERRGADRPEKRPEHGRAFYSTKKQGGAGFVSRYGARTRA